MDKKNFHSAVAQMKESPDNIFIQREYFNQVATLGRMLLNQYKHPHYDKEDVHQDLLEFTIKKDLHKRVDPGKDIFSYYWSAFKREIWRAQKTAYKKADQVAKHGIFEQCYTDDSEGVDEMLKELNFRLEDYDLEDAKIDNLPVVMTSKPKRGRPSKRDPNKKAKHWEKLFLILKEKKQMDVDSMVECIPETKRERLKNPANNIKMYMKEIAKREGVKLTISNNIYHLIS